MSSHLGLATLLVRDMPRTKAFYTKKEQVFNGTFKAKDQDIFDV